MLRTLLNVRLSFASTSRFLCTPVSEASTASGPSVQVDEPSAVDEIDAAVNRVIVRQPYSGETITALKLDQYPYYVEKEWWKKGKRMTFWATWRQISS